MIKCYFFIKWKHLPSSTIQMSKVHLKWHFNFFFLLLHFSLQEISKFQMRVTGSVDHLSGNV